MDLSARVSFSLDHWHLQDVNRLAGGFRSDVFSSMTSTGEEVVLKLTVTTEEAQVEAAALAEWNDTGATVRLIDVDVEHAALLLERIRPATPLPGNDDGVAIEVVTDLLSRLHRVSDGSFPFPTLEQIYPREEAGSREDAAYEQRSSGDPTRGLMGLQHLLDRNRPPPAEHVDASGRHGR